MTGAGGDPRHFERSGKMSVSDAQEFLRQLTSDPDLAKADAAARRRELVELARENGFEITEEDLVEASRTVQDAPYSPIDDETLDAIVGGCLEELNISFN